MKEAALYWLRYEKQMTHICTEFGRWSADVAGACKTRMVEIEVKTHHSDLRRDHKKYKHRSYDGDHPQEDVPNYFFFLVPPFLEQQAIEVAAAINPKYGVLIYDPLLDSWQSRHRVAKRSARLHPRPPSERIFERMAARMSTEIVAAHALKWRLHEMSTRMSDELKNRFVPTEETAAIWSEDEM